jgi:hypothetical protein
MELLYINDEANIYIESLFSLYILFISMTREIMNKIYCIHMKLRKNINKDNSVLND